MATRKWAPDEDNGVMRQMSGAEISDAGRGLPLAEGHPADEIQQRFHVPSLGDVLVTFKRHRHKRGKSTHIFWVAVRADPL